MKLKTHASETWQRKRGNLNHAWLKSEYLNLIKVWPRRCKKIQQASELFPCQDFRDSVISPWESKQNGFIELLDCYEDEMSARYLTSTKPVSRASPKSRIWLGEVLHCLWMDRRSSLKSLELAYHSLERANASFGDLENAVEAVNQQGKEISEVMQLFHKFEKNTFLFSESLSNLDREIHL